MPLSSFPALNASLNATTAFLLLVGWALIKSDRREAHRWTMVAAFLCSTIFLACYLWYHVHVGSVRYQGTGALRVVYFTILLTALGLPPEILEIAKRPGSARRYLLLAVNVAILVYLWRRRNDFRSELPD